MAKLDKETALRLSEPVEDAYLDCVDRLVQNICKHLGTGKAFRTADWETQKLAQLGQLTQENAKIINAATKKVPREIRDALHESSEIALADIEKMIREAIESGALEQAPDDSVLAVLEDLMEQALDDANLTNTTMLQSSQVAYMQAVEEVVQWETRALSAAEAQGAIDAVNELAVAVTSGTETRNQALKKAISQLSDRGIYGFVDSRGRHWSPEAYMAMEIRTASHNAAIDSIRARQTDYGVDIFQVSSHPGARPLCYPYQGRFFTWGSQGGEFTDGKGVRHRYRPITETSYGKPAGLFGINCGHYPMPQIPRVTIPQDKPEPDKEENDKEYRESQEQRRLEREIREAKRKQAAYKAAGLEDAAEAEGYTVAMRQAKMRAFIKRTGRRRRYDREQIK